MKLHEIQQALEALGVWRAIKRATYTGGGGSGNVQVVSGGGTWGTIAGNIEDQTDLINKLEANDDVMKRYIFLMS